ncbi:hypothetical protein LOC59_08940 [Arthrobacter sp. zg-Y916]|uniref:hypothetical protein n=1 Tax=Arthrobacter sp. zg-Y916 TaxID=2894190 RepID=UPI001E53B042|nr:hypothetical protein [Arthrobacter sp. zg-Y916]MCC9193771.1 hypothetical protein [Arthrobacter sp. zg-Y916]
MGRHRAEPVEHRRGRRTPETGTTARRNPELLAWGVFLTGTSALSLTWAEIPAGPAAGASALLLTAFILAWYLSPAAATKAATSDAAVPARIPALQPSPVSGPVAGPGNSGAPDTAAPSVAEAIAAAAAAKAAAPEEAPLPRIPAAPEAVREFLGSTDRPSFQQDGPSRWTRTFGPPETGSLPLQPYVPTRRRTPAAPATDRRDRSQRSHSSF